MVLIHGWCGTHKLMAAQADAFRASHRVISVDLRGYGDSDAPEQEYTFAVFADDVAWLCEQLKLVKPVVVGHSMGGVITLELAVRHPHVAQGVVIIDAPICQPQAAYQSLTAALDSILEGVSGPNYVAIVNGMFKSRCLPTDAIGQRWQLTDSLNAPQHVVWSCLRNHATDEQTKRAARACKLPIAYIAASKPLADLTEFKSLTPQLQIGTVLGTGHFCPQEAPEQANAMIARFIHLFNNDKTPTGR